MRPLDPFFCRKEAHVTTAPEFQRWNSQVWEELFLQGTLTLAKRTAGRDPYSDDQGKTCLTLESNAGADVSLVNAVRGAL